MTTTHALDRFATLPDAEVSPRPSSHSSRWSGRPLYGLSRVVEQPLSPRRLSGHYTCKGMIIAMSATATRWPVWALIREARRRASVTQAELAARVGTSQPAIARYERARSMPDLATLHRIVEACGLELGLELAEPDPQREAAARIARERTPQERLEANTRQVELVRALRHG
jgi:transcriptional regulator with XRE-family HTH domain